MNQKFVPLTASGPANAAVGGGSSPKGGPNSKLTEAFRPITQAGLASLDKPTTAREPKVTLVKNGERVTSIKIQCVCGHTIELACE